MPTTTTSSSERLRLHYQSEINLVAAALAGFEGDMERMAREAGLNEAQTLSVALFARGLDLPALRDEIEVPSLYDVYRKVVGGLNRIHNLSTPGRKISPAASRYVKIPS